MITHRNEKHFNESEIQLWKVATNVKFPPKSMTNVTFFFLNQHICIIMTAGLFWGFLNDDPCLT